ncbi:MAG: hypothetical protein M3Q52_07300 [Pseudomonadota bacterium]|nr:hypothetical protein [Pseudomonadota bacterium]
MARNTQNGRGNNGNQKGRSNNNAEGRNQFSNGWRDTAKERPVAAAAAAAAAVGAGVFLWSRRNQITDQISNLSDQFNEWSQSRGSTSYENALEFEGQDSAYNSGASNRSTAQSTSQTSDKSGSNGLGKSADTSETGGNASFVASSGDFTAGSGGRSRA